MNIGTRIAKLEQALDDNTPIEPMLVLHDIRPEDVARSKELEAAGVPHVLITICCARGCPPDWHCQGEHGCRLEVPPCD